jgi:hypothetical protein
LRAASLLTGVFLALYGWTALGQALPPYKMVDSGFPAEVVDRDIQWLDKDRVLFRGVVLGASKGGYRIAAHVWDTKQNKVEPSSEGQKVPQNPCCKPHPSEAVVVPLLEEHGWLDVSGPSNIVLFRSSGSPGVETSIPRQAGRIEVRYIPWANRYLVIGNAGPGAKVYPAWYLRLDGSTTKVKWPPGEWQASADYLATRRGLLVWARQGAEPKAYVYGHFLIRAGVATRIAPGFYWTGTSVSPDGCKVAFRQALNKEDEARGYREWKAGRPANTLRMIDVCEPARADRDG